MAALPERDHHLVRAGQVILADKGFAGKEFEAFLTERLGVHLVRPDRKDEPVRHGLEQHGGRTPAGVFVRTGQRLLALAVSIWHNWITDAKVKRSLIAYDH